MIVIGDNMMRLVGIMVAISIRNDMVEFVYILIMCHRIYDVMGLHLYVLGDVVNFLFVISYCTSPFIDVTKGVVTGSSKVCRSQEGILCPTVMSMGMFLGANKYARENGSTRIVDSSGIIYVSL